MSGPTRIKLLIIGWRAQDPGGLRPWQAKGPVLVKLCGFEEVAKFSGPHACTANNAQAVKTPQEMAAEPLEPRRLFATAPAIQYRAVLHDCVVNDIPTQVEGCRLARLNHQTRFPRSGLLDLRDYRLSRGCFPLLLTDSIEFPIKYVTVSTRYNESGTSPSRTTSAEKLNKESNCLRISTQLNPDAADGNDTTFTRHLLTDSANNHIRSALLNANVSKIKTKNENSVPLREAPKPLYIHPHTVRRLCVGSAEDQQIRRPSHLVQV